MAFQVLRRYQKTFFSIVLLLDCLSSKVLGETGDCRQQEFRDHSGNCVLCRQCGPGMELSKECGFGYGEDAQCVTCRPHRFKEGWGFQKCRPCLDCALVNRFQKANCSLISDAICGDCLPGFYRKTKLVGFQDMECVPCGDPPPPYEPHCTSKVNLVKIASTASSPRDTALAAVICSALATVLLALLILCVIYCKRQFMEKKPSWSLRSQDIQYSGSELSCFDRPQHSTYGHRACCQCHQDFAQTYRPVHLIPSLCCEEACGSPRAALGCGVHSKATPQERSVAPPGEARPALFGTLSQSTRGEFSDSWPLMHNSMGSDELSSCDSYPEIAGEYGPLDPDHENAVSLDSDGGQEVVGGAVPISAHSGSSCSGPADVPRHKETTMDSRAAQDALIARSQLSQEAGDTMQSAILLSCQEA